MGVLTTLFSIFVAPFSEHQYILKALEKLYLAKTEQSDLFLNPQMKNEVKEVYKQTQIGDEISKHYHVKLSFRKELKLFFSNLLCIPTCLNGKFSLTSKRLLRMYKNGVK